MFNVKKRGFWFAAFIFLLFVFCLSIFIFYSKEELKPEWDLTRTIRYGFVLQNTSSQPLQNIVFKTYSPLVLSSSQKLIEITSSTKFTKHRDSYENQQIWFDIGFIPPYGKKSISITAKLLMSSVIAGAANETNLYTSEQPKIESNNEAIIELSHQFKGIPTTKKFQKLIYEWQIDNMTYIGYGFKNKGAVYALTNLEGDCTEFAYLNVAINRALGVASRAVNGYVVNHDSKLVASEYHTWSEVWLDGGWHVVDAQKKEFMNNQQNYIAMNIVTDTLTDNNQFNRFWVSNPNLTVTMK